MEKFAVIGKMHSGKSTASRMLIDTQGAFKVALADPVKEISYLLLYEMQSCLCDMLKTDYDIFWDAKKEVSLTIDDLKGHPSVRKLLQLVGTELGRDFFGPKDVWIKIFEDTVATVEKMFPNKIIVCDDCRFLNEAEALKKSGFKLVRIVRPEEDRKQSVISSIRQNNATLSEEEVLQRYEEMQNHPSETELASIDADLTLFATNLKELDEQIRGLVQHGERV